MNDKKSKVSKNEKKSNVSKNEKKSNVSKNEEEKQLLLKIEKEIKLLKQFRKKCLKERSKEKKPINEIIIKTFYESPQLFFAQFKKALKYSSYFDICHISIFMHYFYLLYEEHKNSKKTLSKKGLINEKILSNINIYQNNFSQFIQEHREKLLVKDLCEDTFFHKIAKFHDKTFFVKICEKLNTLEILNKEQLRMKNKEDKTCCDYVFEEIKSKYDYYMYRNSNDYEILKNFVIMIKKDFSDIYEPIPFEMKILLNHFILKNNFEIILKPNFGKVYSNIESLYKKEKDISIYNYIFLPYNSGINYLNLLFNICKSADDYNSLYNFVNQIANSMDNNIKNNKNKYDFNLKEFCLLDHINYSVVKMNSSKNNGKLEIDYGTRLIKNILKIIITSKDDNYIIEILQSKKDFFQSHIEIKKSKKSKKSKNQKDPKNPKDQKDPKNPPKIRNTLQNGLNFNLMSNNYLNFEQKMEILSIINEVTHGLSDKQINEDYSFYVFYKYIKTSSLSLSKYGEDKYITKIVKEFILVIGLYNKLMDLCDIYAKDSLDRYISLLNDFILKNNLFPNYKVQYNISKNNIQQILQSILSISKQKNDKLDEELKYHDEIDVLFYKFMSSDENLCKYSILNSLKNKNYFDALKLLFSFKYDFSELIDLHVKNLSYDLSMELINYLLESDNLEKNTNINLEKKLIQKLKTIINSQFFCHFPRNKNYKKINAQKLHISIIYDVDEYYSKMKGFVFTHLNYLLNNWDKPLNYNKIINEIKDLIPSLLTYSRIEFNKYFLK